MTKKWFGYGLLVAIVATFVMLWVATEDPVGAFLSLVVFSLGGALLFAVLGYLISNSRYWTRRLRGISWDEHLKDLESSGQAVREQYRTIHSLTFEELNTGCLVHVIDVGDDRLLCLFGQQYYDYEPIDDDPELNQPRQFPTKTFSLLRHVKKPDELAIFPGDEVVEPTVCDPIVRPEKLFDLGFKLRDGELVTDVRLEAVKLLFRQHPRMSAHSR